MKHTAVGVEEANVAVFISTNDYSFYSTRASRTMDDLLFAHCPTGVKSCRTIESDGGGDDGVNASRRRAIICLKTRHAHNFLASPCIIHKDGSVSVGHNKVDTCKRQRTDARWGGRFGPNNLTNHTVMEWRSSSRAGLR